MLWERSLKQRFAPNYATRYHINYGFLSLDRKPHSGCISSAWLKCYRSTNFKIDHRRWVTLSHVSTWVSDNLETDINIVVQIIIHYWLGRLPSGQSQHFCYHWVNQPIHVMSSCIEDMTATKRKHSPLQHPVISTSRLLVHDWIHVIGETTSKLNFSPNYVTQHQINALYKEMNTRTNCYHAKELLNGEQTSLCTVNLQAVSSGSCSFAIWEIAESTSWSVSSFGVARWASAKSLIVFHVIFTESTMRCRRSFPIRLKLSFSSEKGHEYENP